MTASVPARAPRPRGPYSADRILYGTSPLLRADIHAFLVTCISGWDENYTEEEKRSIIDSLPPTHRSYNVDPDYGKLQCPLSMDFVVDDPFIRAAIGKLKRDVEGGCYEKGWQNRASRAMEERMAGKFDAYLEQYVDEQFGQGGGQIGDFGSGDVDGEGCHSSESDWAKSDLKTRRTIHDAAIEQTARSRLMAAQEGKEGSNRPVRELDNGTDGVDMKHVPMITGNLRSRKRLKASRGAA